MKISITGHETSGVITYTITPDSFQCLTVDTYKISNAIDLFNKGVETLINDIRHIEGIDVVKIKNLVIKYDLSNDDVDFELDSDAWYAYKKYLCEIEGRKAISAKRKNELLSKGNITVHEKESFYDQIITGDIIVEDRLSGDILEQDLEHADPNSPFYDKKVVFTGVLESISRSEAAEIVKAMGADINNSISSLTDYVIVGADAGPSKLKKIEDCNAKGANIRVIFESEFLKMIK